MRRFLPHERDTTNLSPSIELVTLSDHGARSTNKDENPHEPDWLRINMKVFTSRIGLLGHVEFSLIGDRHFNLLS
jgi:hypothetical protein